MLQLLKPVCLEPVLYNKRSHRMRSLRTATKSSPHSLQLEKARTQQKRPNADKKKKKKKWAGVTYVNEEYVVSKIQRGPLGIVPLILVVEGTRCTNLSFALEEISPHVPHNWVPRNFAEVEVPEFCQIYFPPFDIQVSYQ